MLRSPVVVHLSGGIKIGALSVDYVRQIIGRPGEVWGAESGLDRLVVLRTGD